MLIDFENIEDKCRQATLTEEYYKLIAKVNLTKKIFLMQKRKLILNL